MKLGKVYDKKLVGKADLNSANALTEFGMMMTDWVLKAKNPMDVIYEANKNYMSLAGLVLPAAGAAGAAGAASIWVGSLGAISGIGYWLGVVSIPLWVPAAGFAAGAIGTVSAIAGFKSWSDSKKYFDFIKVYYSCLTLMKKADREITDSEIEQIEEWIDSLKITDAQKEELQKIDVSYLSQVDFPTWLEHEHKLQIIKGCWALAYCDGLATQESNLMVNLGEKLEFTPDEITVIRDDVTKELEDRHSDLISIGTISSYLIPGMNDELREKMVDSLASLDTVAEAKGRLEDNIKIAKKGVNTAVDVAAVVVPLLTANPAAGKIISASYVLAKTLLSEQPEKMEEAKERFKEIENQMHQLPEGTEFMKETDELFANMDKDIKTAVKKLK